eukprot:scaffold32398_cov53-Attheya_sp.AAC.1
MATPLRLAPSAMIHAVPPGVQDRLAHTPPDPTVAIDWPLEMRVNRYRPSKSTSIMTAVASTSLAPTLATPLRPAPSVMNQLLTINNQQPTTTSDILMSPHASSSIGH